MLPGVVLAQRPFGGYYGNCRGSPDYGPGTVLSWRNTKNENRTVAPQGSLSIRSPEPSRATPRERYLSEFGSFVLAVVRPAWPAG